MYKRGIKLSKEEPGYCSISVLQALCTIKNPANEDTSCECFVLIYLLKIQNHLLKKTLLASKYNIWGI